jgi:metal-responsive CopG/Arc/MetJ family transcriptional regulator
MKVKTSVTLSDALVKAIDRMALSGESRSQAIERMLREGLAAAARRSVNDRDLALINKHADELNAEAAEVLAYQADV